MTMSKESAEYYKEESNKRGCYYVPAYGRRITAKQLGVVLAVCDGLSNKAIASRIGITEKTVKFHLSNIFKLFGIRSRSELMFLVNDFNNKKLSRGHTV